MSWYLEEDGTYSLIKDYDYYKEFFIRYLEMKCKGKIVDDILIEDIKKNL